MDKNSECSDGPKLRQLTPPVDHGEGPTWDERTKLLYFVDLHAGKVISYDPATENLRHVKLNGDVTPVIPSKDNTQVFIVGLNRSVVVIKWDPKGNELITMRALTTVANEFPTSRFNDGKADAKGRLWFGTMGFENASGVVPNEGSLYLITRDNIAKPQKVITPVNISNGLAWNKANTKFYYIDTPTRQVRQYDFDLKAGKISNQKIVFDVAKHKEIKGFPDGMTIDEDDKLWVALYDGGAVVKVDPETGEILQIISLPAQYVTSVAWGGDDLDVLYVTTSRTVLNLEGRKKQPAAGSLFAIYNLGTRGLPSYKADILDKEKDSCFF